MSTRTRWVGTMLAAVVLLAPGRLSAQEGLRGVTRHAEEEFRRHVNEYQDRMRGLNFSGRPNPQARRGMNETIVNNYRSHLSAMTRVRNESDAEISHMAGVSPVARRNAIQEVGRAYGGYTRTLREHEERSMQQLREAGR